MCFTETGYKLLKSLFSRSFGFLGRGQRQKKVENGFQKVCRLWQDGVPGGGDQVPRQDLAQGLFQVYSLWHDPKHEELQRI